MLKSALLEAVNLDTFTVHMSTSDLQKPALREDKVLQLLYWTGLLCKKENPG